MSITRASLLWAIGIGKSIDLLSIIFMALCSAYDLFDVRGSVTFTEFHTALFKKNENSIPIDLIRVEP